MKCGAGRSFPDEWPARKRAVQRHWLTAVAIDHPRAACHSWQRILHKLAGT